MTERASGRHRASHKSSTPLATLTGSLSVVGDYVGSVRRSGVIIAMSSGLVATMALPAHAVNATPPEAGPQTASIPAVPASGGNTFFTAPEGGLLALPPDLALDDETVAAPAAATVDFDHSSFTVVSRPSDVPDTSAGDSDTTPAPASRRQIRLATSGGSVSENSISASGSSVLAIAFRYQGVPYRWGGTSPSGFDCSGFTQYVFRQLGKSLPRTVAEQRGAVRLISRSQARPGDLVFFGTGHVGIFVGDGKMIDAPHRGSVVSIRSIYSANVVFGRA